MGYVYNDSFLGKMIMTIVTGISNLIYIPSLVVLYKQKRVIEFWYGVFTIICSSIYHILDSIDREQCLLSIDQWHKLDNIGSISCLLTAIIYLMQIHSKVFEIHLKQSALFIVILFQEYHPFLLSTTFYPILIYFFILFIRCIYLQ